jgi:Ca-activated chloride channel family protein
VDQFGRQFFVNETASFDEKVLKKIAEQTGGKYFSAKNTVDMNRAYDEIDKLERTKQEKTIFTKYEEIFGLFFSLALVSLFVEIFASLFVWKSLG